MRRYADKHPDRVKSRFLHFENRIDFLLTFAGEKKYLEQKQITNHALAGRDRFLYLCKKSFDFT